MDRDAPWFHDPVKVAPYGHLVVHMLEDFFRENEIEAVVIERQAPIFPAEAKSLVIGRRAQFHVVAVIEAANVREAVMEECIHRCPRAASKIQDGRFGSEISPRARQ